ncbi:hypothetical protein DFQ29_004416 [Apophysomyces sp. BC1021]|nr:hypothetical protein DFQ29_004416 [Apophysomyces sp. BC1021]
MRLNLIAILCFLSLTSSRPVIEGTLKAGLSTFFGVLTGENYRGKATFFRPATEGGPIGSCGPREDDNSPICALNLHQYGDANSKNCCPGCDKNSLDLTRGVFKDLAAFVIGIIDIEWYVLEDGDKNHGHNKRKGKRTIDEGTDRT